MTTLDSLKLKTFTYDVVGQSFLFFKFYKIKSKKAHNNKNPNPNPNPKGSFMVAVN